LDLQPARGVGSGATTSQVTTTFNEVLSEVTGRVVLHGVTAVMRSSDREKELDARLVPGIPSDLQHAYLGGIILGLFGLATARSWWQRVWPPEIAAEYGSQFGFRSAWLVRGLAFMALFLPVAGLPAFLVQTGRNFWAMVTAPFRWLARWFRAA
jgi:hypothetical protein